MLTQTQPKSATAARLLPLLSAIPRWLRAALTVHLPGYDVRADNPVYRYGFRALRGIHTIHQIRRWILLWIGLGIASGLLIVIGQYQSVIALQQTGTAPPYIINNAHFALNNLAGLIFQWSVVATFVVDAIILVQSSMLSVTLHKNDTRTLLLLSSIEAEQILAAEQAIAQTRAWRFAAVEIGARLLVAVLIFGAQVLENIYEPDPNVSSTALLAAITPLAVLFCLEPYWRMRVTVAYSLRVAARTELGTFTVGALILGMVVLRLLQALTVCVVFFALLAIVIGLWLYAILSGRARYITLQAILPGDLNMVVVALLLAPILLLCARGLYGSYSARYLRSAARDLRRASD